ncbi:MAG: LysM peptidoglycan-binding domain-containing protein [Anaerolineales bacterium]|nr:LysM peptidoglycan-binding domain-containing protein [Anaerolineales bacterium]
MPYWRFLALNVVVSAVTVLLVLSIWGRNQSAAPVPPTATVDIFAQVESAIPSVTITKTPSPTPEIYTVKQNDTLFAIALELGIPMEDLMAANDIRDPASLDVGQELIVPDIEGRIRPTSTATPKPAADSAGSEEGGDETDPAVSIERVDATGDIETEQIFLLNNGGVASMMNWTLDDGSGHVYLFPNFTLHNGGGVMIHVGSGTNVVADLYWGLNEPILSSGITLRIRDADGKLQSEWTIP